MTIDTGLAAAALAASGMLTLALWHVTRRQAAAFAAVEARMTQVVAGVTLLTDTPEGGLRDVALEGGRLGAASAPAAPPSRRVSQRRVASAAQRGRTVQDIAAAEHMSEGEVRLRLNLEKKKGRANATVR